MSPQVVERPPATTPDPWATAPVAVGPHRHRLGWVLLVLVLVAGGAVALLLGRQVPTDVPAPPAARPQPAPAEPAIPPSVPFDVTVEVADVATMDNGRLFGRDTAIPDRAVEAARRQIDTALTRYLDGQFVTAATRFSDDPLGDLLSRRALGMLSEDDRAGLGALGLAVEQVQARPVTARARLLTGGDRVVMAAVRYDARATAITGSGETMPLRQRATMVFVREAGAWRVAAVTAELDLSQPGEEVSR